LPDNPTFSEAVTSARRSVVRVTGSACNVAITGSGYVVDPDLVITNAHVIAGVENPIVTDTIGPHRATPVFVDPRTDIAVLRIPSLHDVPLRIGDLRANRGTSAAVLSYPRGGPLRIDATVILGRRSVISADIYGHDRVSRDVMEIQFAIQQGSSGGAVVDSNAALLGIVFGASTNDPRVSYALPAAVIRDALAKSKPLTQAVPTGSCVSS
jgi:S1-C subfamily serine protease